MRSYSFVEPSPEVAKRLGFNFDGWKIGRDGPLKLSYPATIPESEFVLMQVCYFSGLID